MIDDDLRGKINLIYWLENPNQIPIKKLRKKVSPNDNLVAKEWLS